MLHDLLCRLYGTLQRHLPLEHPEEVELHPELPGGRPPAGVAPQSAARGADRQVQQHPEVAVSTTAAAGDQLKPGPGVPLVKVPQVEAHDFIFVFRRDDREIRYPFLD